MKLDARVAHEAGHWWTEVLRDPMYPGREDPSTPNEDALKELVTYLANRLTNNMEERTVLQCDYEPKGLLADAARHASVPQSAFPTKHTMIVYPDHIAVKQGYSAPWDVVFSVPGWVRPVCDSPDVDDLRPSPRTCGKLKYHQTDCGNWREP